jgi:hypothetical protein
MTCCCPVSSSAARTSPATVLIDQQVGKGHVVLFGVRPFWRYETSGNYSLVFNAMLNWDHLNAGR